jgi:hypothetical protein
MKIPDLYVVEWSEHQHTFHVTTVREMLDANCEVLRFERASEESDWLVVAIEPSYDAAHARLRELQASLDSAPPNL